MSDQVTTIRQNSALGGQLSVLFAMAMFGIATWLALSGLIAMEPWMLLGIWLVLFAALGWSLRKPYIRIQRKDGVVTLRESHLWGSRTRSYGPGDSPPEMTIREAWRNSAAIFHLDLALPSGRTVVLETMRNRMALVGYKQQMLNLWEER